MWALSFVKPASGSLTQPRAQLIAQLCMYCISGLPELCVQQRAELLGHPEQLQHGHDHLPVRGASHRHSHGREEKGLGVGGGEHERTA